jgi:hypothetical protein
MRLDNEEKLTSKEQQNHSLVVVSCIGERKNF